MPGIGSFLRRMVGVSPPHNTPQNVKRAQGRFGRWSITRGVNVRMPRGQSAAGAPLASREVRKVAPDSKQYRETELACSLAEACQMNGMNLQRNEQAGQKDCIEIYGLKAQKNFLFSSYEFQAMARDANGVGGKPQTYKGRSFRFHLKYDLGRLIKSIKGKAGTSTAEIELGHLSAQVNDRMKLTQGGKCLFLGGQVPGFGNNKHAELSVTYRRFDGHKVTVEKTSDVALRDSADFKSWVGQLSGARRCVVALQLASDMAVDDLVSQLNE